MYTKSLFSDHFRDSLKLLSSNLHILALTLAQFDPRMKKCIDTYERESAKTKMNGSHDTRDNS